jgi:hypothetical protein
MLLIGNALYEQVMMRETRSNEKYEVYNCNEEGVTYGIRMVGTNTAGSLSRISSASPTKCMKTA